MAKKPEELEIIMPEGEPETVVPEEITSEDGPETIILEDESETTLSEDEPETVVPEDEKPRKGGRAITVLYGYRGAPSGEAYIPPGVYAEDDEVLRGLADYLVKNGHAIWGV